MGLKMMIYHSTKRRFNGGDKMNKYAMSFVKTVLENPELQVIPLVQYEVCCGDDYSRWAASIGKTMIKEFYFDNDNEGELIYKEHCTETLLQELETQGIKWDKAIFLFIDLPDLPEGTVKLPGQQEEELWNDLL
jgi:hypothetical protein